MQKLIFMAPHARIEEIRPLITQRMAGKATLTTALPGMLEVGWVGGLMGRAWLQGLARPGGGRALRVFVSVRAQRWAGYWCDWEFTGMPSAQQADGTVAPAPPTTSCARALLSARPVRLSGAATGRLQGSGRALAAGLPGSACLRTDGSG